MKAEFSILFLLLICAVQAQESLYSGKGKVCFISEAPLETIQACSDEMQGILDLSEKTFAFNFRVRSFVGFNSPLQKEHFNEHYLETTKYPHSTFTGKIIGLEELITNAEIEIYAKGKLTIHGISQIVRIPVTLKSSSNHRELIASALFDVDLEDYDISIPVILEAKISPDIQVKTDLIFKIQDE